MPLQNFGVVSRDGRCRILRAAQPDVYGLCDLEDIAGPFVSYRLSASDEGEVTREQEVAALVEIGCTLIHDPRLGAGLNPSLDALHAVASDINAIFERGETVLVHCHAGRERTGAACAAWRLIYGGATLADVEDDLKAYGIEGVTALADTLLLDAVRDLAKELGK